MIREREPGCFSFVIAADAPDEVHVRCAATSWLHQAVDAGFATTGWLKRAEQLFEQAH
jgi:hypothetical protein